MFSLDLPRSLNATQKEQTMPASSQRGLHGTIRCILGIFVQCQDTYLHRVSVSYSLYSI